MPFYPLTATILTCPVIGAEVLRVQPVVVKLLTKISALLFIAKAEIEGAVKKDVENVTFLLV